MKIKLVKGESINAVVDRKTDVVPGVRLNRGPTFHVVARDPQGNIKWEDDIKNLVVTEGLNELLDVMFGGVAQTNPWAIGLTDGTPTPAAGDTMASHVGWVEVIAYDEAVRQAFVESVAAAGSIDNVGNEAVFTISADATTIGGAFIPASNTKSETASVLYAVGAFTAGDKLLDDNDTLTVTVTLTAADDGV